MKQLYKLYALGLVTALAIAFVLNPSYLTQQVKYLFGRADYQPNTEQQNTAEVEKGEPNILSIPSLNVSAPIVYALEINEDKFQEHLQSGVVHYPDTALLGQPGNAYIFGHSSDFALSPGEYKTVFALLPKIEQGAEIVVTDPYGTVFRYKVYDQFVAENTDTHLLDQNTDGRKILTVQTSYPIGTALKRYIVKAELVE